jgi:leucyl-tRNA synthetase
MVVAPEHPLVHRIFNSAASGPHGPELHRYVEWAKNRSDVERMESKEKTGAFTGVYAINPATNQKIPIWTADYVLMGYGTGAIMAVPGQDTRDWEFAKKFNLPIVRTVQPSAGWDENQPFLGDGSAINSSNAEVSLDGLGVAAAKARIIEWLEAQGIGTRKVNFKLRDWVFSRQRYWGEPFPIVYDAAGNHYPVSDAALPVKLPPLADFHPIESDEPKPLLAKATGWLKTTAGAAGVSSDQLDPSTPVTRETNTMPGWAGSCWYFLRYADPKNPGRFVGEDAERYWMGGNGVDLYIGGAEHAVLHLLYARFWHSVLFDLGHVSTPEPFKKLFHQGLITSFAFQRPDKSFAPNDQVEHREQLDGSVKHYETATGKEVAQVIAKMSKSLKNVFNPDDVIAEFGADTFRLYEMYMGPLEASKPWNPRDIAGCFRFVQRAWRVCIDERTGALKPAPGIEDPQLERLLHRTIAKVGADIERLAFNTAIAAMIEFVNAATSAGSSRDGGTGTAAILTLGQIERFACTLAPFTPHVAEELWKRVGEARADTATRGLVVDARWPTVYPAMLEDDSVEIPVQVLGKVRHKITVSPRADAATIEAAARADDKVRQLLADKPVKKVIVVPGKLINFVTG